MKKLLFILLVLNVCHAQASDSAQRPTTPFLIKVIKTPLVWSEEFSNIDREIAKAKKSGTLEATDKYGYTAIHHTKSERWESFEYDLFKKLINGGSRVNARSFDGTTVLHLTAIHDVPEAVRTVLEAGALPDLQMNNGRTPLHLVIESLYVRTCTTSFFYTSEDFQNKIKIARMLLKAKARTDLPDNEGRLPLAQLKNCEGSSSTLHALARKGEVKTLRTLAGLGMCMHPEKNPGDGITPLHEAQTAEVTKFFLTTGANVHAPNSIGNTPLHTAQNSEIALALLTAGAKINARNHEGNTPLHIAALTGSIVVARLLLRYTRPPKPCVPEKAKENLV